jgi:tight adherence protein B
MLSIALILLAAALGVIGFGFANWRERAASPELEERLQQFGSIEQLTDEIAGTTKSPSPVAQAVGRAVEGSTFSGNVATLLARASLKMTVGEFLVLRIASVAGLALIGFVLGRGITEPLIGILVAIITGGIGWMIPQWYVSYRAKKRTKEFVNQLGDTIGLMSNSLRAGYSLFQTMELVARESQPPMSEEFSRVVREVGLGITPQDAMDHLLRRITSEDLDLLVTAINIQHEVGGNMAQILDVIGETIRERVRIKGEINVLTAQGSMSGYIISGLPVALTAFLFVTNRSYMSSLFTFPWVCMPIAGAAMVIAGFFAMRKIVQIDV